MIEWNFPSNQNGQIKGVADAGIENFNGTELSSLARENCQNSLDAAIDDANPNVIVEFERHYVKNNEIPGIDDYRTVLQKCKIFWDKSKSEKAKIFLHNAFKHAKNEGSFVLRISDYNTTGLSEPYGNPDNPFSFDGWNALIKIDGGANKGDDKAGAFGIGKSAPFSNSHYRLVFYRTLNQKNEQAAQGISRLLSYPTDLSNMSMTSGIGYYGEPNGNNPVEFIPELDNIKKRTQIGTDVFIFGFKGTSSWESEITNAILENFLMSIYNGMLTVKIQKQEINQKTLPSFIYRAHREFPGLIKGTYGNFLALTEDENVHFYSRDFHNLGTLELRIYINQSEKLDRKILVVRKSGMKLFRMGNLSRLVPFSGILELKGKALNSYFRQMETVAHDNWEPGRHQNPKQAKAYYEEIKEWIRSIISELAENASDDEMDVDGLGGVLQTEPTEVVNSESDDKQENLNNHLGKIDVIKRTTSEPTKGFFYGLGEEGKHDSTSEKGTLGPSGNPGVRILKGKRKRKKTESHRGVADEKGSDIVQTQRLGGETSCPLKNVRIIKRSIGEYSILFNLPYDVAYGRIEVVTIGENGKSTKINIKKADLLYGCTSIKTTNAGIEATDMHSSDRIGISISFNCQHDYAMEVNVYEHN